MGLLSRLVGSVTPAKKATDDVLLLHGMLLMAGADGNIEHKEIQSVQAFFFTLPEFAGKDFGTLYNESVKLIKKHGGVKESVNAIKDLSTAVLKRKLFVVAADIAMSSGDVDEAEDAMLETYQRLLDIDDGFASRTIEILGAKYAS
jgi:uncharacterized tellurite resistance protein B-like protein